MQLLVACISTTIHNVELGAVCLTAGTLVPANQEKPMQRRPRRNHTPAFKAKVSLAAIASTRFRPIKIAPDPYRRKHEKMPVNWELLAVPVGHRCHHLAQHSVRLKGRGPFFSGEA
jgi:hypothetical protein